MASVRLWLQLRFVHRTVRAVLVICSDGSSGERMVFSVLQYCSNRGERFRCRFLKNGSGGSVSAFGSLTAGSDRSGSRFQSVLAPPWTELILNVVWARGILQIPLYIPTFRSSNPTPLCSFKLSQLLSDVSQEALPLKPCILAK